MFNTNHVEIYSITCTQRPLKGSNESWSLTAGGL